MPRDEDEEMPGRLLFCWRWAKGNRGSGGFLALRSLKNGVTGFLGVVLGLDWDGRPFELASDLEDSDCRLPGGVRIGGFGTVVLVWVEGRGDSGSSNVANEGRDLSSAKDFPRLLFPRNRLGPS